MQNRKTPCPSRGRQHMESRQLNHTTSSSPKKINLVTPTQPSWYRPVRPPTDNSHRPRPPHKFTHPPLRLPSQPGLRPTSYLAHRVDEFIGEIRVHIVHQGVRFGDVKRIKLDGDFLGRTKKRWTGQRSSGGVDGFLGECLRGSKLEELRKPKGVSLYVDMRTFPRVTNEEKKKKKGEMDKGVLGWL